MVNETEWHILQGGHKHFCFWFPVYKGWSSSEFLCSVFLIHYLLFIFTKWRALQSSIQWVKDSCQHLYLWLASNCEAQQASEQHGGEGAAFFSWVFTEQLSSSHVDSMMASKGLLCAYEILNLLGPRVRTDHLQTNVACSEPGDQMSLTNTHA